MKTMDDGPDNIVSITTCYKLDGLEFKPQWEQGFLHPSGSVPWPTKPPVHWVLEVSFGMNGPGCDIDHPLHLVLRVKKE